MSVYNSIPIANCSINKYEVFKKYNDTNKDPLTQEIVLELPPFELQPKSELTIKIGVEINNPFLENNV